MNQRHLLYAVTGRDAPRQAMAEITRLEGVFLKARKRKLTIPLFLTDIGTRERPCFGITAAFESVDQRDDVAFLMEVVTPSEASADSV